MAAPSLHWSSVSVSHKPGFAYHKRLDMVTYSSQYDGSVTLYPLQVVLGYDANVDQTVASVSSKLESAGIPITRVSWYTYN